MSIRPRPNDSMSVLLSKIPPFSRSTLSLPLLSPSPLELLLVLGEGLTEEVFTHHRGKNLIFRTRGCPGSDYSLPSLFPPSFFLFLSSLFSLFTFLILSRRDRPDQRRIKPRSFRRCVHCVVVDPESLRQASRAFRPPLRHSLATSALRGKTGRDAPSLRAPF